MHGMSALGICYLASELCRANVPRPDGPTDSTQLPVHDLHRCSALICMHLTKVDPSSDPTEHWCTDSLCPSFINLRDELHHNACVCAPSYPRCRHTSLARLIPVRQLARHLALGPPLNPLLRL